MASAPSRRARKQALISRLAEPSTLDDICAAIASGQTLSEWCRLNGALYAMTHEWVHSDSSRLKRYAAALEVRSGALTDRFVQGVRVLVDADPRRAYSERGVMLATHKLPDDVAMALDGIETTHAKDGTPTTKLRLVPKGRALELLGRHLGAFRDKLDVDLKVGMADRLHRARQRVLEQK